MNNIQLFDQKIENRYRTLIKNIKNKSNSFYDSYLDLLEETIKYILTTHNVKFDATKTCGTILQNEYVKFFFIEKLKVDNYTYSKLPDYIKKCNDHKHKKERQLSVDSVVNYLRVYFDFINFYKKYINEDIISFNPDYFVSIFNDIDEKNDIILDLLEEQGKQINELRSSMNITNNKERAIKEEQYLKNSKKSYIWIGSNKLFVEQKKNVIIFLLIVIACGILSTIFTSVASKIYTTFTLFENIWAICMIYILIYTSGYTKKMEHDKFTNRTIYKYNINAKYNFNEITFIEKSVYKAFRIINYISIILNIIYIIIFFNGFISILAILIEIGYFVMCIIAFYKYDEFENGFHCLILFEFGTYKKLYNLFVKKYVEQEKINDFLK